MASRQYYQFQYSCEKFAVSLYANLTIGSSGAVTISANNNKGIYTVTKTATGVYKIVFGNQYTTDVYKRVLALSGVEYYNSSDAAGTIVAVQLLEDNSASGNIVIGTLSATGTLANSASGSTILVRIDLANSV